MGVVHSRDRRAALRQVPACVFLAPRPTVATGMAIVQNTTLSVVATEETAATARAKMVSFGPVDQQTLNKT